jgi:hypothetical protein
MAITNTQAAAHEAGHAIMSLAIGWPLTSITMTLGQYPGSKLASPDFTFATECVLDKSTEARLTYLPIVGGMAGEIVLEGRYHTLGAEDDLSHLHGVKLTDLQIEGLTNIAVRAILAEPNYRLWKKIQNEMLIGIRKKRPMLVDGPRTTSLFQRRGQKFTDYAALNKLLPL